MRGRIVAVDEVRAICRLLQVALERADYYVAIASDATEAIDVIDAEKPDLVVLSTSLPGSGSLDVLRHLSAQPGRLHIPVIALGAGEDSDVFRLWQSGAEAYFRKPFHPMELLAAVERVLSGPPAGPRPAAAMHGNLWVDVA